MSKGQLSNIFFFPQIGEGRTEIEVEVQKSSTSQVTSGIALEETGMGKPETSLGCMSNQAEALDQEQQPEAAMRYVQFCFVDSQLSSVDVNDCSLYFKAIRAQSSNQMLGF